MSYKKKHQKCKKTHYLLRTGFSARCLQLWVRSYKCGEHPFENCNNNKSLPVLIIFSGLGVLSYEGGGDGWGGRDYSKTSMA